MKLEREIFIKFSFILIVIIGPILVFLIGRMEHYLIIKFQNIFPMFWSKGLLLQDYIPTFFRNYVRSIYAQHEFQGIVSSVPITKTIVHLNNFRDLSTYEAEPWDFFRQYAFEIKINIHQFCQVYQMWSFDEIYSLRKGVIEGFSGILKSLFSRVNDSVNFDKLVAVNLTKARSCTFSVSELNAANEIKEAILKAVKLLESKEEVNRNELKKILDVFFNVIRSDNISVAKKIQLQVALMLPDMASKKFMEGVDFPTGLTDYLRSYTRLDAQAIEFSARITKCILDYISRK